jgi:hypothetical protein
MQEVNIIQYRLREFDERNCKKDKSIIIGGKFCTELCGNFKGYCIKDSSLLCNWEEK